jgi:outer membrane protein OmpA-like peptidoglycan-associated protein
MAVLAALCFLGIYGGSTLKAEAAATSDYPLVQINKLEQDLRNAQNNQVNVLAPISFAEAEKLLHYAKKRLDRGSDANKILQKVAEGLTQLQVAQESAQRARKELADLVKARDLARAAGATNFGYDYENVESRFLELTKAVERNKVKRARKNAVKVAAQYRQLELRAIKEQTLGEARKLIKQAEKEGAWKIAPKTHEIAQKKLKEVDQFISKNRYQKLKMHNMANEALLQAGRLVQVTRQSKTIRTMKPEQTTLWVEGILYDTASSLSTADMRDQPLGTQVDNILGSIAALQEDHRFLINKVKTQKAEIEAMNKQIAHLEDQTREYQAVKKRLTAERQAVEKRMAAEKLAVERRLAAEKRFNQLFREVRGYFGPSEAEVYKQGSDLVIRLKAIQFPVGKDVIMPDNYSVLSKAQRAIRTFGEPGLVIEGHTDSTGSEVSNEHLSQRRAEAVRAYLVANGTLPAGKIVAVGYGSKRPLASNKTKEGRAINRRIDVIIKAEGGAG